MSNFVFKKSLGQNFIHDDGLINRIVDSAMIDKNTLVIEIGPGAGALSEKIIPLSKNTILYEIDSRLEDKLRKKLDKYDNYELIIKDILTSSIQEDISKYEYDKLFVVANIPYYITSPIITKLMDEIYPDKIIIMIQEEVADRLVATPHNREYGLMSVLVSSKYNVEKLFKVSKEYFTPMPKVDSAVVRLIKRDNNNILDYDLFLKLLKDSFRYKRKNIKNNLYDYDLELINSILNKYKLSINNRSEEVSVEVFIEIANSLSEHV